MKVNVVMDKKRNKLLFVESDSDFVDFLFHILSLPLRTLAEHLSENTLPGSLGKLHQSFQNLEHRHFIDPTKKPAANQSTRSSPVTASYDVYYPPVTPQPPAPTKTSDYYSLGTRYVKGSAKYMVTDDLRVSALDAGSIVDAVKSCAHPGDLEYKVVDFGSSAEAVKLLKAILESETSLTSVFVNPPVEEILVDTSPAQEHELKRRKLESSTSDSLE